jgi:long-chain acyl-CoA synthetase
MDFGRIEGKKTYSDNGVSSIRINALKRPKNLAVLFEDNSLTWSEFWERSNRLANAYIKLGLKKGDRVQIFLPNCIEYPEVVLGGNLATLINTAGNYRLTGNELVYQLNDCGAKVIVFKTREQFKTIKDIQNQVPSLKYLIMIGDDVPEGALSYNALLSESASDDPGVDVLPDDIHLLMYTGGTTGYPKGAARTNKCDYHMANAVCHELGLNHDDVYLAVAPMYAAASMGYLYASLLSGGAVGIVPAFVPDQVFMYVEKYRATWTFMVPIMYDWILSLPDELLNKYDISSLKHVAACGAPLHNETVKKMLKRFDRADVSNWLGASEFGFISKYSFRNGLKEEGCVGKAVFDLELKLFDENGNSVSTGEPGLLYGRGYSMWEGYFNKIEATKEAYLDHEWGTVGDIARQDENGDFYIVDRKNDVIITGGINVYPAEIENILKKNQDIVDSAVIGVPDDKWGEAVKAVVVKKPNSAITEAEIIEFCRKYLAGFKIPKSVDFVEQVPRSFVGKALKKELRKKYWANKDRQI